MMKILILLFLVVISTQVYSQNLTLYGNEFVPQSVRSNPSMLPTAKFHFGLPMISSIGLSAVNSGFFISDMFEEQNGKTQLTMTEAISKMADDNYIGLAVDIDYLSFGFKVKDKNYFALNLTERVDFNLDYSKNFMRFINEGPGSDEFLNEGDSINIENTGFRFNHYRELGLTYNRQINDNLNIGIRPKLLIGLSNFQNETTDIAFYTNPKDYELTIRTTIGINTAGLSTLTDTTKNFDPVSYLTNSDNKGFGLDLGANYKINDKISTSISMTDFGIIKWKTDAKRYFNNNATFTFDGLDFNELMANDSTYIQSFTDSIQEIFGLQEVEQEYYTYLSTKFHLGGSYKVNKGITMNGLLRAELFKNRLHPSVTVASNFRLRNFLMATLSYSILNRSYNNLGGALVLNLGKVQLYAASDNIFGVTRMDYAKNLNTRFGMNVIAGHKDNDQHMSKEEVEKMRNERKLKGQDTDGDGVDDFDDICPEEKGSIETFGCPDSDEDGVYDLIDKCPTEMGFLETDGCPDTDNDGVPDVDDECPEKYGPVNGCPDSDKDGVSDKNDKCPETPGIPELNGCIDTDSDGITDNIDTCPEKAGDTEHGGCPDSDGDGIYDDIDQCPLIKGTAKLNGCSNQDSDRDGIPDIDDDCPYRAGFANKKGCP
jgi:hypothetical protein